MQDSHLAFFASYIEKNLGIVYSPANYFQLEGRLNEILAYFRLTDVAKLQAMVEVGPSAEIKQLLLDSATNNETSFFRDMRIYDTLREHIVPALASVSAARPLRIWSAAASTGQEAYSIAMTLRELGEAGRRLNFQILASDISKRVLDRVRDASYSQLEIQRGLPTPLMLKYFSQENDGRWRAKPLLRSHVTPVCLNLTTPFSHVGKFDVVFCRNVLIYQNLERKADIVRRIANQLEPNGFLVLGAGESLIGLSDEFDQREHKRSIVFQLKRRLEVAA